MSSTSNQLAFCVGPSLPFSSPTRRSRRNPFFKACTPPPWQQANLSDQNHLSSPSRRRFLARLLTTAVFTVAPSLADQTDVSTSALSVDASASTATAPPPPPIVKPPNVPKWSYVAPTDPSAWGSLSPDYSLADSGNMQSPIALSYLSSRTPTAPRPTLSSNVASFSFTLNDIAAAANPSLTLQQYVPPPSRFVGDAPPVDLPNPPPPPAFITYDGTIYAFRSAHFHAGASEHVIENTTSVLEMHLVFDKRPRLRPSPPTPPPANASETDSAARTNGEKPTTAPNLLVVALAAKEADETEPWLSMLLGSYIETAGEDGKGPGIRSDFDVATVLSAFDTSDIFVYSGSFTTPPCTEGVAWLVMNSRFKASAKDVAAITRLQGGRNVRPLQPINGRPVFRYPPVPLTEETNP